MYAFIPDYLGFNAESQFKVLRYIKKIENTNEIIIIKESLIMIKNAWKKLKKVAIVNPDPLF